MERHRVVSQSEWIAARKELLAKEKEFTRRRDQLSEERRALPWVLVNKEYSFDTNEGRMSLPQLFGERSQLIVYHFMYAPEWDTPCKSCSFWADSFDRNVAHLAARDARLIAVSRAPLAKLNAFKERMGWTFEWVSSGESDFNYDFNVSFRIDDASRPKAIYNYQPKTSGMTDLPGISAFYKDANGAVFYTYSAYARGLDMMNAAYQYLDLTPKGRDEAGQAHSMAWVRYRDSYGR